MDEITAERSAKMRVTGVACEPQQLTWQVMFGLPAAKCFKGPLLYLSPTQLKGTHDKPSAHISSDHEVNTTAHLLETI